MRKKTRIAVFAAAVLAVAAMCVAGCNGTAQEGDSQDAEQATEVSYAPKVRQLEDGTIIQLTPYDDRSNAYYFQQRDFVPYNTYWVHADERGCKSCHDNLRELLQDMDQYNHGGVDTILEGVEWDINTCIDCHTIGAWYYFVTNYEKLSTLIHAQHQDVASCWNCHDTQEDYATGTTKMVLWENVKYEKLRGIYTLTADEMTGDFTYTQDYITPVKDMYNLGPEYSDADRERYQKHEDGVPLDQELYDNWSITVDGTAVAEPKTFMLKDIMENGPIQTITCTFNCATARVNAGAVGQFEVTGVPLSWVFDQCDISEDAALCCGVSVDYFGYDTATEYPTVYEMGMLATEINGEPLS